MDDRDGCAVLEFVTDPAMLRNAIGAYGIQAQVIGRNAAGDDETVGGGTSPRDLPVESLTGFEWWVKRGAAGA
jgi:hypothetical protein